MENYYTVAEMTTALGTFLGGVLPWAFVFWCLITLAGAIAQETVRRWRRKKDMEQDKYHVHWCEGCGRAFHDNKEYEVLRAYDYQTLGELLKAWWRREKDQADKEGTSHL